MKPFNLQLHFVDQNSRRSDSESQQRVQLKQRCPYKYLQPEELAGGIPEPASRHDTATNVSKAF